MSKETLNLWLSQGWEMKEETEEYYELTKNTQKFGIHVLIFIISMWFSGTMMMYGGGTGLGIFAYAGNIIYYFMSKKKKRIMK